MLTIEMFLLETLSLTAMCYCFSVLLMREGEIFSFYDDFLARFEPKYKYVTKPLGRCAKCFAGQVALWYFIDVHRNDYSVHLHILFVLLTILITDTLDKTLNKWLE